MGEVRWTTQAADDLESITAYIARDSEQYAGLFTAGVLSAVDRLAAFPEAGRVVPEVEDHRIREVLHGNYRIVYRHDSDVCSILTVWHGARPFDPNVATHG